MRTCGASPGGLSHSPLAWQYLEFVSQPARAADLRGATGGASPLLLPTAGPPLSCNGGAVVGTHIQPTASLSAARATAGTRA